MWLNLSQEERLVVLSNVSEQTNLSPHSIEKGSKFNIHCLLAIWSLIASILHLPHPDVGQNTYPLNRYSLPSE